MTQETVKRITAMYGYAPTSVLEPASGYRNQSWPVVCENGNILNVIIFKQEADMVARIRRSDRIGRRLANAKIAARTPLSDRLIKLSTANGERYAGIYNYLQGSTIPWEAYTASHIKLLGESMAKIHHAVAELPRADFASVASEYIAVTSRMASYLSDSQVAKALAQKLGIALPLDQFSRYKDVLKLCDGIARQQVLHMDLVRSNVLFQSDGDRAVVSGVIDFEKAAYGSPLFDIARTLSFLLVDCKYKSEPQIRKYFLQSGYTKRGGGKVPGIAVTTGSDKMPLLEQLVDMFLLYDFYKFLRHNPYESLLANEHFVRTARLLLDRRLLSVVDEITWPPLIQE